MESIQNKYLIIIHSEFWVHFIRLVWKENSRTTFYSGSSFPYIVNLKIVNVAHKNKSILYLTVYKSSTIYPVMILTTLAIFRHTPIHQISSSIETPCDVWQLDDHCIAPHLISSRRYITRYSIIFRKKHFETSVVL